MVWELLAYGTERGAGGLDVRHCEYTSSKRRAEMFEQIPRIQFTDSGHGIVFCARPHKGTRKPTRRMDYVAEQLAKLKAVA